MNNSCLLFNMFLCPSNTNNSPAIYQAPCARASRRALWPTRAPDPRDATHPVLINKQRDCVATVAEERTPHITYPAAYGKAQEEEEKHALLMAHTLTISLNL